MFTQCPECQTTFRLRLQQLKAAGGQVRCSRCDTIFDALDHMVTAPQPSSEGETVSPPTEASASIASAGAAQATYLPDTPIESESQQDDDWLAQLTQQSPAGEAKEGEQPEDAAMPDTHDSSVEKDGHKKAWSVVSETEEDAAPEQDTTQTLDSHDPDAILDANATQADYDAAELHNDNEQSLGIPLPPEEANLPADELLDLAETDEVDKTVVPDTIEAFEEVDEEEPASAEDSWDSLDPDEILDATQADYDAAELDLDNEQSLGIPLPPEEANLPADELLDLAETDEVDKTVVPDTIEAFEEVDEEEPASAEDSWDSLDPDEILDATQADYDAAELDLDNEQSLGIPLPPEEANLPADDTNDKNDLEGWEDVEATEPALSTELATELDLADPWVETESFLDEMLPEMPRDQVEELPVDRETNTLAKPGEATTDLELPAPEPVEYKAWDAFSEQHIESLLTPVEGEDILDETPSLNAISELTPDSEEYASEAPSPQQDVAETLGEPQQKIDEDEALLQQLLPEDDTELDQDLDRLYPHNSPDTPARHDEDVSAQASTTPHPGYSLEPETASPQSLSLTAPLLWGGGVLALIATLALQFVYYNHSQIAHHTQLRPWVDQLCQWTECELPPQRDLGQIRLASHLVQFHPRFQDSLLITATLINRAGFTQPYPEVEIQMTDLQQRVVASRRFHPEEYLVGQRSDRPMPQNIEIPLMLEVVDPGKDVVGFRFEFY